MDPSRTRTRETHSTRPGTAVMHGPRWTRGSCSMRQPRMGRRATRGRRADASPSVICTDAGTTRKYCSTELTHDEAAAFCATQGMTLTSVMNSSDNGSMINGAILFSGYPFWIGLDDIEVEGDFRWDDGSTLRFTGWDPGQPDDAGGAEDCVISGFDIMAETWDDVSCAERHSFVCGA